MEQFDSSEEEMYIGLCNTETH